MQGDMDALRAHFDHELAGIYLHDLSVEASAVPDKPRTCNHRLEDTADSIRASD